MNLCATRVELQKNNIKKKDCFQTICHWSDKLDRVRKDYKKKIISCFSITYVYYTVNAM